jgi:APA family basic amino acid/polyamine antiporter
MSSADRPLQRILGVGFGLAMCFGSTVGVGILRLPGTLAAALGDERLIMLFWVIGGVYALLGAMAVSELAAMLPSAGGFYVYAQRAFGDRGGFVIGWSDWIVNSSALAYVAVAAASFLATLWPPAAEFERVGALAMLTGFTVLHCFGLRMSRTVTTVITITVGVMLLTLVVACFAAPGAVPAEEPAPAGSAVTLPLTSMAMLVAIVSALRSVLATFDGWYGPIYVAGESADPARTLPRAIVGGTAVVAVLYLFINAAFIHVLPLSVLAASPLPAADAAARVLPDGGAQIVTVISIVTLFSVMNATVIAAPRILVGLSRAGLGIPAAAAITASGTPRVALLLSSSAAGLLILTGTFDQIIALGVVLFVLNYVSAFGAVFVLRRREPSTPRPYRALGFPATTAIVLIGSLLFMAAAVAGDRRSAVIAGVLLVASLPAYGWLARRRQNTDPATSSSAPLSGELPP